MDMSALEWIRSSYARLAAGILAGAVSVSALAAAPSAPAGRTPAAAARSRYQPDRFAGRAGKYYQLVWGVDSLAVKLAESGEVVRFSYRVLDPARAGAL